MYTIHCNASDPPVASLAKQERILLLGTAASANLAYLAVGAPPQRCVERAEPPELPGEDTIAVEPLAAVNAEYHVVRVSLCL